MKKFIYKILNYEFLVVVLVSLSLSLILTLSNNIYSFFNDKDNLYLFLRFRFDFFPVLIFLKILYSKILEKFKKVYKNNDYNYGSFLASCYTIFILNTIKNNGIEVGYLIFIFIYLQYIFMFFILVRVLPNVRNKIIEFNVNRKYARVNVFTFIKQSTVQSIKKIIK